MALDITRQGRRSSSRFGSKPSGSFKRSKSRSVVRLNQGSSPHGQRSVLGLNKAGGAFGSGRPAGGGGAGALAAALSGLPAPSVEGPAPQLGPPPVDFREQPFLPPSSPVSEHPVFPSDLFGAFQPVSQAAQARGSFPTFAPSPINDEDERRRRLGSRFAF